MGDKSNGVVKSLTGELRVLAAENGKNGWRRPVELWVLNSEVNNNNWQYLNLEKHRAMFALTPILVAYVGSRIGDGHNFVTKVDGDGQEWASYMSSTAERIVGVFPFESDIRIEAKDGVEWIVGRGFIWEWYARELVDKLKKQGLEGMEVSVETLIDEMRKEGTTEVFERYQILGTTILGDNVNPAVRGANIRALSEIGVEEVKKLTLRVASTLEQQQGAADTKEQSENPQKIIKKGVHRMKVKDLEKHFPEFTVVAVDGENVALLSDKGMPYMSTAVKDGEDIVIGVKTEVEANTVFVNGETQISVPADAVTEKLYAKINGLEADLEKARTDKEAADKRLEEMKKAEFERRKEAVCEAVKARLYEIKEGNDDVILDEEKCAELTTDERVGEYAKMETNGHFVGVDMARKDLDAICMDAILATRANSQKSRFAWDTPQKKQQEPAKGMLGVMARLAKNQNKIKGA